MQHSLSGLLLHEPCLTVKLDRGWLPPDPDVAVWQLPGAHRADAAGQSGFWSQLTKQLPASNAALGVV